MDHVIQILEREKKLIERYIREADLLQNNMRMARLELLKVSEIKKAIKIIKLKKERL